MNMPDSIKDEIKLVWQFESDGKYTEALDLIENIEGRNALTEENCLWCIIFKAYISGFSQKFTEAAELGKKAYDMSQKLDNNEAKIDSLLLMSMIVNLGQLEESIKIIDQVENLLKTSKNVTYEEKK